MNNKERELFYPKVPKRTADLKLVSRNRWNYTCYIWLEEQIDRYISHNNTEVDYVNTWYIEGERAYYRDVEIIKEDNKAEVTNYNHMNYDESCIELFYEVIMDYVLEVQLFKDDLPIEVDMDEYKKQRSGEC